MWDGGSVEKVDGSNFDTRGGSRVVGGGGKVGGGCSVAAAEVWLPEGVCDARGTAVVPSRPAFADVDWLGGDVGTTRWFRDRCIGSM